MKLNAWTVGLLGAGVVSLPAVSWADESTTNAVPSLLTGLAATTLSGYVDTSAHWNPNTGNANLPTYTPNGAPGGTKADGFNLDVVNLTISHPVGEGDWGAGYNATLLFGPDAVGYNPSFTTTGLNEFSLKDTYVELKAPLGNGLDFKLGTYTEVLGYEVYEAGNNPNYTRSYGYMIEPTQMTGLLMAYQFCPVLSANFGICDTWSAGINSRSFPAKAESFKTYMGSITLTAPKEMGFLAGSTLSGGVINGYDAVNAVIKTSLYAGATINTGITGLKAGVAWDYVTLGENTIGGPAQSSGYQQAIGGYLVYQATEKLSLNSRVEYFNQSAYLVGTATSAGLPSKAVEFTETIQYDLWKNVIARAEFRWDHAANDSAPFSTGFDNAYLLAANIIYKF